MDKQAFEELRLKMEALTPTLTNDLLETLKRDPDLSKRYGTALFEVAHQGTIALRDVLLGAVEFEHPTLVTHEMHWLDKLLAARQINPARIDDCILVFRARISSDLPPAQAAPLLETLNKAMKRFSQL